MPQNPPSNLKLTPARAMALKVLLQQILCWPDLSSICMDEYEHEAIKNLYKKLCGGNHERA